MDERLLLDGWTSAIADILFIYSVLQIIIPCLSELGIDIFHNESIFPYGSSSSRGTEQWQNVIGTVYIETIMTIFMRTMKH